MSLAGWVKSCKSINRLGNLPGTVALLGHCKCFRKDTTICGRGKVSRLPVRCLCVCILWQAGFLFLHSRRLSGGILGAPRRLAALSSSALCWVFFRGTSHPGRSFPVAARGVARDVGLSYGSALSVLVSKTPPVNSVGCFGNKMASALTLFHWSVELTDLNVR